jgi:hypothetical protein
MRGFSSAAHLTLTESVKDEPVRLTDPALPAVQHLVGVGAIDVLRLPIEATGGVIDSGRPVQVQYRPGSDVVVRYSAQVSWRGEPAVRETLVASSTIYGAHPGALLVSADAASGPIEVGVWRWPFDPVLVGLEDVVSSRAAAAVLGIGPDDLSVDIVAYRPTDRVVVRVARHGEPVAYVKVVPPARAGVVARRHDALISAGVPAAPVRSFDGERGLIGLEVLRGPTLRELIKSNAPGWPVGSEFMQVSEALAGARIDGPGPASNITDGVLHANMLAAVLPDAASVLDQLVGRFETFTVPTHDGTVHGDLHEGQVIVEDGRIVGLLDVDDVGPGASIDDLANLIARIRFRAATATESKLRLLEYAASLRADGRERHDVADLDVHTAAALVGLATGPFRIQSDGWRTTVAELLDLATDLSMRELSA